MKKYAVVVAALAAMAFAPVAAAKDHRGDDGGGNASRVAVCQATGAASKPFVFAAASIDTVVQRRLSRADIIPAFYFRSRGATWLYTGQNLRSVYNGMTGWDVLRNACRVPVAVVVSHKCKRQPACQPSPCAVQTCAPVDVCGNLAGAQTSVPAGYMRDTQGNCVPIPTCKTAQVSVCVCQPTVVITVTTATSTTTGTVAQTPAQQTTPQSQPAKPVTQQPTKKAVKKKAVKKTVKAKRKVHRAKRAARKKRKHGGLPFTPRRP